MEALDPDMEALDPDMEALDPDMEVIDPDMEALDPDMEVIDPDMEVIDPDMEALDPDMEVIDEPQSSTPFMNYIQSERIPARLPASPCDTIGAHHQCVSTEGCGWLRTIGGDGVCRADPVARCLSEGECLCHAHDFHGDERLDQDLELFIPLSIIWKNLAPSTSTFGGGVDRYVTQLSLPEIIDESLAQFTSRTDFTRKTLDVNAVTDADLDRIADADGLSLSFKFMHVWDQEPAMMGGVLFEGLGVELRLTDDRLSLIFDGQTYPIIGEDSSGQVKTYQCNQLALVIPSQGDATLYLGAESTSIPGLNMSDVQRHMRAPTPARHVLTLGSVNAKIWDLRLYGNGHLMGPEEIADIGRRCGVAGDYEIPSGYPQSNQRYSWGMGGSNIVPQHATQSFSSGVYVTMRIPESDSFPPVDPEALGDLKRMIGFWDRWHEQMFFELDMIPFVDTRPLDPEGASNTYRNYPQALCDHDTCGELINYNNPCRYVTDFFQAFNWLPEDFPNEPTSADHRRIAMNGGWTRWAEYDSELYAHWTRPVHEHGHTAHFTLMRTYNKTHHYIRGISGESFAEVMSSYVLPGTKSWMNTGLTYYPSIPLSFEGRWDPAQERHVFKSSQPYQERNIDDLGLGARFYGLGTWWTFVSHFAAKPYMIGRISADTDETPGTSLQRMRFYLAQEGLDLGELFGNFVAHVATWDWPYIGPAFAEQEREPFQGIAGWCTQNTGPDCTIEDLKIQVDLDPQLGTEGAWVEGPDDVHPGGFAYNTIRISSAPGGALYKIGLEFEVPEVLYSETDYSIGLRSTCRDDSRFFSSRIVVADVGSEGHVDRTRPQYYKIPGRLVEEVIIQVPQGRPSNIYLLPIPTPPFELEDVTPFVQGYSLVWPYRYSVERLDLPPVGMETRAPIQLEGTEMLSLTPREGAGFVYDCFYDPALQEERDRLERELDACLAFCELSGFISSDLESSCNQQLSCMNACAMRFDGLTSAECEMRCDRLGTSGCSPMIGGRTYRLCGPCLGAGARDLPAECAQGCAVGVE